MDNLKNDILELVRDFSSEKTKIVKFSPGETSIPASGKCLGIEEYQYMTEAVLDGWLTTGRFNTEFQNNLASAIGVNYALTTNSGSSAKEQSI